tara:strand:- start:21 stop:593 length:573 start_codon:yes stop_codon:yes gene_type:complete
MALKTVSMSTGGGLFTEGWHELEITKAKYGIFEGPNGNKRYLDIWFDGYPDNMNLRVYESFNKTTKDEWKIANIFKFANAGIAGVLKDPTGKQAIQFDDEANGLIGKRINTFFYKEDKTGNEYTRIFDSIAPVEQEGEHLSFTDKQVASIKQSVEAQYNKSKSYTSSNNVGSFGGSTEETKTTADGDMPW